MDTAQQNKQTNKKMKTINKLAMIAVGLAASAVASQAAFDVSLGSFGPTIQFNGSSQFSFENQAFLSGYQFVITTSSGVADSKGLDGSFGSTLFLFDPSTGLISTPGLLTIHSSSGDLTAHFTFQQITQVGSVFGLNGGLAVNLNTISYTGTVQDLKALKAAGKATLVVSFQTTSPYSITDLASSTVETTSSASIRYTPVPEPATFIAGLGALALFGFTAMPKRKS
jgi:hypothetical protein